MKRIIAILGTVILLVTACGQAAPTWQEQYDLGVRYLSEGNYEEAIIAFTAAIEIDPKQPDTYLKLADIYEAIDDVDDALSILEDGYKATCNERLVDRLNTIRAAFDDRGDLLSDDTVVEWDDPVFERMIRQYIGKQQDAIYVGDLNSITTLAILGDTHVYGEIASETSDWGYSLVSSESEGLAAFYVTGTKMGNFRKYTSRGAIKSVNALKYFKNLSQVEIIANQVNDVSVLSEMPQLVWANFFANEIVDLTPFKDIPQSVTRGQFIEIGDPFAP